MAVDVSAAGLTTAFAAGAISFLSPCVLPLVPAYVSYIVGQTIEPQGDRRLRTMLLSSCFVLGFTTIFVVLGAGANVLSSALAPFRHQVT
ncbi:cytochrome c biogenesis CcdA family protein, partial [Salmonella enterica]|uniref:cytochrome c biogenesis CcdA family protein n=1 Tax=Salmonella enterica TaxID=28901 RepID=UPI001DA18231